MIIKVNSYIRPLKGQTLNLDRYLNSLKTSLNLIFINKEFYGKVPEKEYVLEYVYNESNGILRIILEHRYKIDNQILSNFIKTLIDCIALSEKSVFFDSEYEKLRTSSLSEMYNNLIK